MARVLVTGATGLVGYHLVPVLAATGHIVTAAARRAPAAPPGGTAVGTGDLADNPDLAAVVTGHDAVVHLAAPADLAAPRYEDYRGVHVDLPLRVWDAAAAAGVGRFLVMSSAKAVAEQTEQGRPIHEGTPPMPTTHYGRAKLELECALAARAEFEGPQTTVLRCPLVYGRGVRGNFRSLLRLAASGLPLPFGSVRTRRSWLYVGNLAAAIAAVLARSDTPPGVYVVDDGPSLALPDLLGVMASAQRCPLRLLPCPPAVLAAGARLAGLGAVADRLLGAFETDAAHFRRVFEWRPPFTFVQGLGETLGGRELADG